MVDALTAERFGPGVPERERHTRPRPPHRARPPVDAAVVAARRITLCGTADLTVTMRGGRESWRQREDRLLEAIRKWRV